LTSLAWIQDHDNAGPGLQPTPGNARSSQYTPTSATGQSGIASARWCFASRRIGSRGLPLLPGAYGPAAPNTACKSNLATGLGRRGHSPGQPVIVTGRYPTDSTEGLPTSQRAASNHRRQPPGETGVPHGHLPRGRWFGCPTLSCAIPTSGTAGIGQHRPPPPALTGHGASPSLAHGHRTPRERAGLSPRLADPQARQSTSPNARPHRPAQRPDGSCPPPSISPRPTQPGPTDALIATLTRLTAIPVRSPRTPPQQPRTRNTGQRQSPGTTTGQRIPTRANTNSCHPNITARPYERSDANAADQPQHSNRWVELNPS
jgi:hypothetical protein